MKYGKDLISRCASTTRTPAMTAVIFANLRGTVRIKSVWAIAKIASTKNGRVSATRRFAPSCDRARSTKTRCPSRISTKTCSNSSRVTANPKPKNSVLVDVHIGHKEIMPPRTGAELKLSASATGAHWLLKWASPPRFRLRRDPTAIRKLDVRRFVYPLRPVRTNHAGRSRNCDSSVVSRTDKNRMT
jgi:hypothetical protein